MYQILVVIDDFADGTTFHTNISIITSVENTGEALHD